MNKTNLQLTLVTQKSTIATPTYLDFLANCIAAGVTAIQLREKSLNNQDLFIFARQLQRHLQPTNIPLIVNDSPDLCQALDAQGLHLGQNDGNVLLARALLGNKKIIGLSVNTLAQLEAANYLPIDYVGLGAIFATKNKTDVQTIWEVDGLRNAARLSKHPVIAIGGIDVNNAQQVMAAGAAGIAAIGAFHDAIDPYTTTERLKQIVIGAHSC